MEVALCMGLHACGYGMDVVIREINGFLGSWGMS